MVTTMKRFATLGMVTLALGMLCSARLCMANEQQALDDWNGLQSSIDAVKKAIDGVVAEYAPNILSDDNDATLKALAAYDKELKPKLTAQLQTVTQRYGEGSAMDDKLSTIVTIDWRSGKHPSTPASQLYTTLKKLVDNIAAARVSKSEALVRDAESLQESIKRFPQWMTDENFDKLKGLLTAAIAFDPNNTAAQEWLKKADAQRKELMAAREQQIDQAKWPGHYENFAGPGKPDALAKSALEWLQKDEKEAKRRDRTFAVAVAGDWVSAKKNILGQTIQWGLPIWSACYFDEEKAQGICRVFKLTILTREGGPEIEKTPPWTGAWTGDNYVMRVKNIAGGRGAGGSGGAGRGYFGTMLWLLLALANIAVGLLAAAPLLQAKVPALNALYATLMPLRAPIGFIVVIIALVIFLKNLLFHFAIFADLLPILAALAAGLVLGKEMIVGVLAGTKAGAVAAEQQGKVALLEGVQVPLGIACLVLGVLHLLIGGWWLL